MLEFLLFVVCCLAVGLAGAMATILFIWMIAR